MQNYTMECPYRNLIMNELEAPSLIRDGIVTTKRQVHGTERLSGTVFVRSGFYTGGSTLPLKGS
ncbi:hypothetical protein QO004_000410 [Rhizobium mesoamericanum]|uniref:hypothetical protein n=1 Tax=Rhizobium mesoamericanum TaxID=1079800 RepID=UPI00277EAD9A|nr:hypothetical protein [Rhizobium mesoamericanum]MDQ0558637.1 hypothetical protein [Rhizobium mesoamericanum]